jgi:hypothetical protein
MPSIAGQRAELRLASARPFRDSHHSAWLLSLDGCNAQRANPCKAATISAITEHKSLQSTCPSPGRSINNFVRMF